MDCRLSKLLKKSSPHSRCSRLVKTGRLPSGPGRRPLRVRTTANFPELILDSIYEGIIVCDLSGHVKRSNPAASRILGLRSIEGPLRDCIQAHSIFQADGVTALTLERSPTYRALRGEIVKEEKVFIKGLRPRPQGLWLAVTASPMRDATGCVRGAVTIFRDISEQTDRLRNERLIATQIALSRIMAEADSFEEAAERLLENIVRGIGWEAGELWRVKETNVPDEQSPSLECVATWQASGTTTKSFWSAAAPQLSPLGLKAFPAYIMAEKAPLWRQNSSSVKTHPFLSEHSQQSACGFPLLIQGNVKGVICLYSHEARAPDTETLSTMSDIGGRLGMFIQRKEAEKNLAALRVELEKRVQARTEELADANARLLLEVEERRQLYEQTQHASRLKDEFLATVSHELRTPLNVILGHSELLREAPLPSEDKESVEAIYRNAKVQGDIINDLLDVSRIITGKLQLKIEKISIPALLNGAVDAVAPAAKAKSIKINVNLDPRALHMQADPSRLQQVIWNLLSNAIKFTPKKGLISLTALVLVDHLVIDVKDNGQGIDPKFLPYVFERFRQEDATTTRVHGGLGLGLSIVRHLVEAHEGTVSVRSEGKGRGAHFTVRLPLKLASEPGGFEALTPQQDRDEALLGVRVLAVDDQADNRQLITTILKRTGAQVAVASSAREALEIFPSFKPNVLLSDISMPEIDGYELIRKVRRFSDQEGGKIPAAALSAYAREEERRQALAAGYQVHVAKPIEAKTLIKTLADLAGLDAEV